MNLAPLIPAYAGIQFEALPWVPAFAGTSDRVDRASGTTPLPLNFLSQYF